MFAFALSNPWSIANSAEGRATRLLLAGLLVLACLMIAGGAEARTKHKKAEPFVPKSAAFVMDAYTGRVLYSNNADTQCYPASLTKVMTLYLVFERLRDGRLKLDTRMPVSAHAANQAPSRLGLRRGDTIRVEDAILGLVTKSANDVAATVAEYIGGTEKDFARMMTAKARALGMDRTQYMNASGLPNKGQLTTARDQATLARRIQKDFPQYFAYFSTEEFEWDGRKIRNHNRLLGKYAGVNGLKTGYTAASGFNLTTTVMRDDKSVIGVVLGGTTARARDAHMVEILDRALPRAVAMRDGAATTRFAAVAPAKKPVGISDRERMALASLASADEHDPDEESYTGTDRVASLSASPAPIVVSAPPAIKPVAAPAPVVAKPIAIPAAVAPAGTLASAPVIAMPAKPEPVRLAAVQPATQATPILPAPRPASANANAGASRPAAAPIDNATAYALAALKKAEGPVRQAGRQLGNFIVTPAQASEGSQATQSLDLRQTVATAAPAPSGHGWTASDPLIPEGSWVIQIGAFAEQADAVDRIRSAIKAAPELNKAVPVTIPVKTANNRTLYRSRFGGFEGEKEARNACGRLARESISCIAIPPANWAIPQGGASHEKSRG